MIFVVGVDQESKGVWGLKEVEAEIESDTQRLRVGKGES